ncbi:DUF4422 domain-containing protein [Vibrio sp. dsl-7]|uniref:DUF4422 domain-containing protein n=1 Tax=Vibrio chanodichtyis TaxID=3027932 RepID=A0ABT5V5E1_9VIBR|nr:DUF4422 domain-containing protein [Vibrio chanodichtyis]MDE1515550.1 DUF4422 domain-containing protein [Vibrio chanodichtyis]
MNKICYLHLGMPKTASTSIQDTLYKNKKKIKEKFGIHYFFECIDGLESSTNCGLTLMKALRFYNREIKIKLFSGFLNPSCDRDIDHYENFIRQLKENEKILISSEILFYEDSSVLIELNKIILSHGYEIKPIIYAREPSSYLSSIFQQMIKVTPPNRSLTVQLKNQLCHMEKIIKLYDGQLILREFNKKIFHCGNIISDFLNILGVNDGYDEIEEVRSNEGLSRLSVSIGYMLHKHQIPMDLDIEKRYDPVHTFFLNELNSSVLNKHSKFELVNNCFDEEYGISKYNSILMSKYKVSFDEKQKYKSVDFDELLTVCDSNLIELLEEAESKLNDLGYLVNRVKYKNKMNTYELLLRIKSTYKLIYGIRMEMYLSSLEKKNIKIYTTHYKKDQIIDSGIITPIHVGCNTSDNSYYEVDDCSGDNISQRNATFCELTAHYWVWKNKLDSNYIGFMHHRRHLCFNENNHDKKNAWGLMCYQEINDDYITRCGLDDKTIQKCLMNNDILIAEQWDVRITGNKNNYDLYKNTSFLHIEDYDKALNILIHKYPEYKYYVDEYNNSHSGFYTNIFIMQKDIFVEYAEWIFSILFELEKCIDTSKYSDDEKRVIGHVAERLVGIYMLKLLREGKYRIKELKRTIVQDTTPKNNKLSKLDVKIKAIASFTQDEKYVPIVVNFNEDYAFVAAACMQSIICNISSNHNYEIFILGNKISDKSIRRYHEMVEFIPNVVLSYIEIGNQSFVEQLQTNQYFSVETYFRLFIPKIFSNFKKVIYLDVDMIVNKDLSELLQVNLSDACIAAVPCYVMKSFVENKVVSNNETGNLSASDYLKNILKIENTHNYIQAGLIVFDNYKLNDFNFIEKVISEVNCTYWFLDQDIINKILSGRIKTLPYNWNVMHGNEDVTQFIKLLPENEKHKYLEARKEPYIVHYAGPAKPWDNKDVEYSDLFWNYLQKTIWFTDIVFYSLHSGNNKSSGAISIYKKIARKIFEMIFPYGSERRVIFSRYYKRIRGL